MGEYFAFHEATNEIPKYVDIAIPRRTHANWIKYPLVKFYQFAPSTWKAGIVTHEIEGHKVRIYNLAKTIADCFKFRNRIGLNVARDAFKIAVTEKGVAPLDMIADSGFTRTFFLLIQYLLGCG